MLVHGCDCWIAIQTFHNVIVVPYVSETIRDDIIFLQEEAAIEGDGAVKGLLKNNGVTGCVVTPLTLKNVPILFATAFGFATIPAFVSGTRNLYQHFMILSPMEDCDGFNVYKQRGSERKFIKDCRINSFELRIEREQSIKLKLDVCSDKPSTVYLDEEPMRAETGERFYSENVTYMINDTSVGFVSVEYKNIYGVTILCKKENGTITELWIRRILEQDSDLPKHINEIIITAKLLRDTYEENQYGTFSITLRNLVLISDETNIECADAVMGQLHYFVNGIVSADTFTVGDKAS